MPGLQLAEALGIGSEGGATDVRFWSDKTRIMGAAEGRNEGGAGTATWVNKACVPSFRAPCSRLCDSCGTLHVSPSDAEATVGFSGKRKIQIQWPDLQRPFLARD